MIARLFFVLQFVALFLPAVVVASAVSAQDKSTSDRMEQSKVRLAPVGHRQPTAKDVANIQHSEIDPQDAKREHELNRRLLICRGC